ncbi:metallophosphoesterase [Corynebacterium sp. 320]|uniref:metallophosphoesterase family protein n=1 Tax=Corynebacterium TaxID=1716 RepID=UPI00125CCDDF|nr:MULTISPECIES: metallophosphoesterase [Corynebacterium]KAB1503784.1 metallophosphoesterase [Corynebacterium sp. 320]KAB1553116.1 metallophosphoesterase [Corynebacterium sp. 321]KAB1553666.1 metallophosphoesterase [Corynebacterium sp. 319]KAB3527920.1 metallophosphoesterase [Corynebacterium sp. 250]KAB3540591.1 metallophosphoesterase [Corynebacterium sp. 366]
MKKRTLWAVSDLHINSPGNRALMDEHVQPQHPQDWLIVAGDIAEKMEVVIDVLRELRQRFEQVIYAPGNHEMFSRSQDTFKGKNKYQALISACRSIGVLTPEDRYPVFAGHTVVPMFTLYDHSWRDPAITPSQAIDAAIENGFVLTDHWAISPFEDVPQWCRERLSYTVSRLSRVDGPTILVNHWPLVREAMQGIPAQDIGLWSGTRHTQQWPRRYRATAVIYGHLHVPRTISLEGVTHVEVSLGYPKERLRTLPPRLHTHTWPYPVLTEEVSIP